MLFDLGFFSEMTIYEEAEAINLCYCKTEV